MVEPILLVRNERDFAQILHPKIGLEENVNFLETSQEERFVEHVLTAKTKTDTHIFA